MNGIHPESPGRGGLAVVFFSFFVVGFLLTLLAQALLVYWQGSQRDPATELSDRSEQAIVEPETRFSPQEVVAYQLEGLASDDRIAGIRQCFAFASPSNKMMTGPLARFTQMVQRTPYDVFFSRQELLIGRPDIQEGHATVTVSLLDSLGTVRVFQFLLTKQVEGESAGCWMTDGVFPLNPMESREPERAPTVRFFPVPPIESRNLAPRGNVSLSPEEAEV